MRGRGTGRLEAMTAALLIMTALSPPALTWGRWSLDDLALILLAAVCLLQWATMIRNRRRVPGVRELLAQVRWPILLWLIAIGWGTASAWVNQGVGLSLQAMLLRALVRPALFASVMLGAVAWSARVGERTFRGVAPIVPRLFAIAGTSEAVIGLVLLYGTLHLGWVNWMDPTVQAYAGRGYDLWAFPRLAGTLGANFAAGLFLLTIPLTAYLALLTLGGAGTAAAHALVGPGNDSAAGQRWAGKERIGGLLWVLALALQLLALWLTYTRAAVLALVLGAILTAVLLPLPVRVKWAVVIGPLLPIVLLPGWWTRIAEGTDRLALWYLGWRVFREHPWFGIGPGNYAEVVANLYRGTGQDTPFGAARSTPHNSFLYAAAETGWPAALALLLLAGFTFWVAYRWIRDARRVPLGARAALWLALAAFGLQNLSNNLLYIPPLATLFWFLSGVVIWSARVGGREGERGEGS